MPGLWQQRCRKCGELRKGHICKAIKAPGDGRKDNNDGHAFKKAKVSATTVNTASATSVLTTATSVLTTAAPVVITAAPVVTTAAPVVTTAAPVVTAVTAQTLPTLVWWEDGHTYDIRRITINQFVLKF